MATDNEAIIGTWELEAWESEENGKFVPRGDNAKGQIIYTPARMSVALTSDGMDLFYAGTWELKDNVILHRAEISSNPEGFTNVRRRVTLTGDRLILRAPEGDAFQIRLTWKRVQ